jgi:hypothetical protein
MCIHTDPFPIESLPPGESSSQDGVIVFSDGDHDELLAHFRALVPEIQRGAG